jgi:hypothetical protein
MRLVDRFVDHGSPVSFRELCMRVLPAPCDYLILDLDKTTHLGRNLGELLAWELCTQEIYGDSAELPSRRWFGGRMLLDPSQPTKLARYLASGARRWAAAGIHYLIWGKLASRIPWLRRLAFRRFGPHPTSGAQRRPQMVALRHLAAADESLVLELAHRVWSRNAPDQVISREDLDWVRARCPDIEIILSSASPKAMLDVAAEELGADRTGYSTAERINSGEAKIEHLRQICPRIFDPQVNVVAITDTGYGEDHCWADHFPCVVDINSQTPFAPIVAQASPVREVHSAILLTQAEQRRRGRGDSDYLDARRRNRTPRARSELGRSELRARLEGRLAEINGLPAPTHSRVRAWKVAYARAVLMEGCRASLSAVT